MEAKDTTIKEILAIHGYAIEEAEGILNNAGRAIYQAGVREVVEFIEPYINILPLVSVKKWQAKLKDWGIKV